MLHRNSPLCAEELCEALVSNHGGHVPQVMDFGEIDVQASCALALTHTLCHHWVQDLPCKLDPLRDIVLQLFEGGVGVEVVHVPGAEQHVHLYCTPQEPHAHG